MLRINRGVALSSRPMRNDDERAFVEAWLRLVQLSDAELEAALVEQGVDVTKLTAQAEALADYLSEQEGLVPPRTRH